LFWLLSLLLPFGVSPAGEVLIDCFCLFLLFFLLLLPFGVSPTLGEVLIVCFVLWGKTREKTPKKKPKKQKNKKTHASLSEKPMLM
jgi:Ca2+/Na+ antiporter